jgi:hypothetical protein
MTILKALEQHLNTLYPTKREYRWLDQINEFPYITFVCKEDTRVHIGADVRYGVIEVQIRAYVREENSQAAGDRLLIQIEEHLQAFEHSSLQDCRVLQVSTDEGVMEPYGVVDLQVRIAYDRN